MQDFGAFQVLDVPQYARQVLYVMSVDGTEVANVHSLENVLLLGSHRFQAVGEADKRLAPFFVEDAHLEEQTFQFEAQLVVAVAGVEVEEVLLHATYAAVDGHVIVVEDDEHVVGSGGRVVQSFKGQPSAHAPVADDGNDVPVGLSFAGGGYGHAQGG